MTHAAEKKDVFRLCVGMHLNHFFFHSLKLSKFHNAFFDIFFCRGINEFKTFFPLIKENLPSRLHDFFAFFFSSHEHMVYMILPA